MTCILLLALLNIGYHPLTCMIVFISGQHSLCLPFAFTRLYFSLLPPLHLSHPSFRSLSTHCSSSLNQSCFLCPSFLLFIFLFMPSNVSVLCVLSLFSFITWKDWEWWHREEDLEDHRFWPGQGVAQNHKNVSSRDLLLDGSWGHQVISLLQRQWCLGVWQITHRTQTPTTINHTHLAEITALLNISFSPLLSKSKI